ncbi:MAG: hypothetical protein R3E60_06065 [Alphaproteobacteria bacterium]
MAINRLIQRQSTRKPYPYGYTSNYGTPGRCIAVALLAVPTRSMRRSAITMECRDSIMEMNKAVHLQVCQLKRMVRDVNRRGVPACRERKRAWRRPTPVPSKSSATTPQTTASTEAASAPSARLSAAC